MPRVPSYSTQKYSYYREDEEGILAFGSWIEKQDWFEVTRGENADDKVSALHSLFDQGMKQSFKWITKSKKTSEPPWMSQKIRAVIAKRRKIFRKEGRSELWRALKKKSSGLIKERRRLST